MLERIDVLKKEIERLRGLARQCDADIAQKFMALANEMQEVVSEMERLEGAKMERSD